MTVTERLVPILARTITDQDRQRAALLLLDWTGCAAAGQAEPAGQKITNAFPNEIGDCSRIGAPKSSPLMAALHNGCLGNVLEMDDVDRQAVLHAAPTIIPAALAIAEYTGASANDFLDSIVIGYEATIRIGRAVGAGHYAFWHNTATCGPFGAAAAACHLLKGSDLVSALGLAGTQAAGLWQTRHEPDSMAKQLHAGHAAHAGVLAAILSAQGFQGPRSILEGEQGFFKAMCPGANPESVLADPDVNWLMHETSLKPYPACRHTHPAIDAALKVELSDGPIVVETYSDALKFCDRPKPLAGLEAKFSLQHVVAHTLLYGAPELNDFSNEALSKTKALRGRISVKSTNKFNSVYPSHYGAEIFVDGKHYAVRDAFGDPEKPMSETSVISKAVLLMRHSGLTKPRSQQLSKAALSLNGDGSIQKYVSLLP
ncbi:MAG: MmgE/PrpD family protein [Alphaproteobacteria bacterium]